MGGYKWQSDKSIKSFIFSKIFSNQRFDSVFWSPIILSILIKLHYNHECLKNSYFTHRVQFSRDRDTSLRYISGLLPA